MIQHIAGFEKLWVAQIFYDSKNEAQVNFLTLLVRSWNVQEQFFQIGDQRLTIDANDIYFLTRLSCRGIDISLFGVRPGREATMFYLARHCAPRSKLSSGRIDIKTIQSLPLRTIVFTVARLCGSAVVHLVTKAQM